MCMNSHAELFGIELCLFQKKVPDKCVSMKENNIFLPYLFSDLIILTVTVEQYFKFGWL